MTDKTTHTKKTTNENADNLAQNEVNDEVLSSEQNTEGEPQPGAETADEGDEEIKKLQAELDELKDKNLRMVAEFDNFRRRTAKERIELTQTAGREIIQSLLVVLDDVDRAAKQLDASSDFTVTKEGISLVFNKLKQLLQQKGLKKMDTHNEEFNPDLHEAITEIPAPSEDMVGKIIDVVEPGYYLNDKLIRHAKVVVGK